MCGGLTLEELLGMANATATIAAELRLKLEEKVYFPTLTVEEQIRALHLIERNLQAGIVAIHEAELRMEQKQAKDEFKEAAGVMSKPGWVDQLPVPEYVSEHMAPKQGSVVHGRFEPVGLKLEED